MRSADNRPATRLTDTDEPLDLGVASASSIAAAIRARVISSEEVIEACLQRIATVNPMLNAVVQLRAEAARAEARAADAALVDGDVAGPLHGVPVTVKMPTTWRAPCRRVARWGDVRSCPRWMPWRSLGCGRRERSCLEK